MVAGIVPPGAWGPLLALRETGADAVGLAAADADGAVVVFACRCARNAEQRHGEQGHGLFHFFSSWVGRYRKAEGTVLVTVRV